LPIIGSSKVAQCPCASSERFRGGSKGNHAPSWSLQGQGIGISATEQDQGLRSSRAKIVAVPAVRRGTHGLGPPLSPLADAPSAAEGKPCRQLPGVHPVRAAADAVLHSQMDPPSAVHQALGDSAIPRQGRGGRPSRPPRTKLLALLPLRRTSHRTGKSVATSTKACGRGAKAPLRLVTGA
jgi:hypothetical protein